MVWGDLWFLLIGIRHQNIVESEIDKSQPYIFVANHCSYIDAAIIVKTVRQPLRILGKSEMTKIPVFGYIYKNAIVTVDRSSLDNRARSVRVLKSVLARKISVFIFPEGTFNETDAALKEFYNGAFRIAVETQTPIKPVIFLDGYNRYHYGSIFSMKPGKSRAVFLEEIPVTGYTKASLDELKNKVYKVMEEALHRYNAAWIGKGNKKV
jgi:1-acyl-sn-glycerol-3-phosphate acyltransferase